MSIAEGSRAAKRARGAWASAHAGAEAALDRADAIFVMTGARPARLWRRHGRSGRGFVDLPPFIDLEEWPAAVHGDADERRSRASSPSR